MTTKAKLQKWGNSQGIRLSKTLLEQIGIESFEKDINFEIKIEGNSIVLEEVKKEFSFLEELFVDYDFKELPDKFEWDENPYGDEIF